MDRKAAARRTDASVHEELDKTEGDALCEVTAPCNSSPWHSKVDGNPLPQTTEA
jgi:hypothetical protein